MVRQNMLHILLIATVLTKTAATVMKWLSDNRFWFNLSGISSGVMVLLGILWAIVFLQNNNFSRIPQAIKIALLATAAISIAVTLLVPSA